MARILFLIGLSNAGKSTASQRIIPDLTEAGYTIKFKTDKIALDEEALRDVNKFRGNPAHILPEGKLLGEHVTVHDPDGVIGKLHMEFSDGHTLNEAHRALLEEIVEFRETNKDEKTVFVVEWAYGEDAFEHTSEPLRQTGSQFVSWLREYNLLGSVTILDIVAGSFQERAERNGLRELVDGSGLPPNEFVLYFKEAGHLKPEDIYALGDRYMRIINHGTKPEDKEAFFRTVDEVTRTFIIPHLEGRRSGIEQPALPAKER